MEWTQGNTISIAGRGLVFLPREQGNHRLQVGAWQRRPWPAPVFSWSALRPALVSRFLRIRCRDAGLVIPVLSSCKPSQGTASAVLAGLKYREYVCVPAAFASAAPCEGFQSGEFQHWCCAEPCDQLPPLLQGDRYRDADLIFAEASVFVE